MKISKEGSADFLFGNTKKINNIMINLNYLKQNQKLLMVIDNFS